MASTASWRTKAVLMLGMIGAVTALVFSQGGAERSLVGIAQAGGPRLIAVEPLAEPDGALCTWPPGSAAVRIARASQQGGAAQTEAAGRSPARMIRDPNASFSAIAVDPIRNEVVMTDENLHGLKVYDRLANTPPTAAFSEPKRAIGGSKTKMEFQCGVWVDPATGDIYTIDNDTHNTLAIFSRQASGNTAPDRDVTVPHGTFGIAVDESAQEIYMTVQHDNALVAYKKMAQRDDGPLRLLQGKNTGLADPHGVAIDPRTRLMFVTNHGSFHEKVPGGRPASGGGGRTLNVPTWPLGEGVPGSGRHDPPSITVYALGAQGDTPPLRTIQGPSTQMNWPMGIAFDSKRNELFVANDTGHSILVFSATASGNVAPVRILKGPKSLIKNPTGVAVDAQNDELWVSNFGNHSATAYKTTAAGDTPPLRVIRSAPIDRPAPILGNPGAVTYDSKRDELLVPN